MIVGMQPTRPARPDPRAQAQQASMAAALKTQGVASVGALTYDKTRDSILSVPAGVVGVRPIDWQNRPTFQQVAQFTAHRPTAAAAPAPSRGALPATGLGLLPLAGLAAVAVALIGVRRRRT